VAVPALKSLFFKREVWRDLLMPYKSPSIPLYKEGSLAVPALKSLFFKREVWRDLLMPFKSPSVPLYKEGSLAVPALKSPLVKGRFRGIYNGVKIPLNPLLKG
jgi:hypothetical protein